MTNIYIVIMVYMFTFICLINLMRLRSKCQRIYFYYFGDNNKDNGYNYLDLRTVLIRGVEYFDIGGKELEEEIKEIFEMKKFDGKVVAISHLLEQQKMFKYLQQKDSLKFYRKAVEEGKINRLSLKLMNKNFLEAQKYEDRLEHIYGKMGKLTQRPVNSGYAFICFNSFEAIDIVRREFRRRGKFSCAKFLCEDESENVIKVQPFINVIDINWANCFVSDEFNLCKILWKVLIAFILIFLTTPAVS